MDTPHTYTFEDALQRVRMNILNYQDCFDEHTEQFKQNSKLLRMLELFESGLLADTLNEATLLLREWSDLGWDHEGCPEGERCDGFEQQLAILDRKATELLTKL